MIKINIIYPQYIDIIKSSEQMIHGHKKTEKNKSEEKLKEEAELSEKISSKLAEFFKIRQKPIDDEDVQKLIQFTTILMQLCSDIGTVYNYRRELITKLLEKIEDVPTKLKTIGGQIKLITKIIQEDPKSYTLWSYRQWLVILFNEYDSSILVKQRDLCKLMLTKDEKNFHVWNYRNWVNSISANVDDQLAFTKEKINSNPFNFSPFHFRSKYLTRKYNSIFVDEATSEDIKGQIVKYGMPKEILDAELENVKTALFLNPKEEAPWLFYNWLLKQLVPSLLLKVTQVQGKNILLFSLKVSGIKSLIEKPQEVQIKVEAKTTPSHQWEISPAIQNFKLTSSSVKFCTEASAETGSHHIIGNSQFDNSDQMAIFLAEKQFIDEVIESEEGQCRFAWLQLLSLNRNILQLGVKPPIWQKITSESIQICEKLLTQTKGTKYVEKQIVYWNKLNKAQDLSQIDEALRTYLHQ